MKAVVLSGGEGTRLRPLTSTRPKPMVKVAGSPMLLHAVNLLKSHGLTDLHVTLHYMADSVKEYLTDGSPFGVRIAYSVEEYPLGTAGSVKKIQNELDGTFIVTSGDVLTDVDLSRIISFHKAKGAAATIAVKSVPNPLQFGIVLTDEEGRINKFLEKPTWGQVVSDAVNIGIYVLEPDVLRYVPSWKEFDFSRNLFPLLLEKKEPLYACLTDGYWTDVGTLEQYLQANRDALEGKVRLTIPGKQRDPGVWTGENVDIVGDGEVEPPVFLGNDVIVKRAAKIAAFTTLCDGVTVEEKAAVKRSIVMDKSSIGLGAQLVQCIVGERCHVGDRVSIYDLATLGDDCSVGKSSVIKHGVKIWPHKSIEFGSIVNDDIRWGLRWTKALFGRSGIVGQTNIEMTPELAAKLGAAIGTFFGRKTQLAAARDTRRSSRMMKRAITAGVSSAGADVHNLRITPSPILQFHATNSKLDGGVYIKVPQTDLRSVSIEVYDERGVNIGRSAEKKIQDILEKEDIRRVPYEQVGVLIYPAEFEGSYLHALMRHVDSAVIAKRKPRVAVDCLNGAGSLIIPKLFADLGCEVATVNTRLDEFAELESGKKQRSLVSGLISLMKVSRADVGFLFDSGASGVAIFDEGRRIIAGDVSLAGMARQFVADQNGGTVVVPITASQAVDMAVEKLGGRVVRCGLGANRLQETILKEKAIFGGDEGRAYICPQLHIGRDGIVSAVKLLEFACRNGLKTSEVFADIPMQAKVHETIECPWNQRGHVMRTLVEEFGDREIDMIEGIKIYGDDHWVAIIPSPDQPLIGLYAEARTHQRANTVAAAYASRIRDLIPPP